MERRRIKSNRLFIIAAALIGAVFMAGCYCGPADTDSYSWTDSNSIDGDNAAGVTVITESGDNRAYRGEEILISPVSTDVTEPVVIKLSGMNETVTLAENYSGPFPFSWLIPSNFPSGESFRIEISYLYFKKDSENPGFSDEFAILENPDSGLSDISVSAASIDITLTDNGTVIDGDTVSISLNGSVIAAEHVLTGAPGSVMTIDLLPGTNTLEITAVNEGTASPNTAEIRFSDVINGESVQEWRLNTGETGSLTISAPL